MSGFSKLYEAGRVKRYHTADVPAQDLASHSWGVAMIIAIIYPTASSRLLMAALTHDLAESVTGDIPATAKWNNKELSRVLFEMEQDFSEKLEINYDLTLKESLILQWADTFELCLYCSHQARMGNLYAHKILDVGIGHIHKKGFPTPEARELFEGIFGA